MSKLVFEKQGSFLNIMRSWASLLSVSLDVKLRRLIGKPIVPEWTEEFEISNLFWREQFTNAFEYNDIKNGREYLDSLMFHYEDDFETRHQEIKTDGFKGEWIIPNQIQDDSILIYLHGGGYAFYAGVSKYFAKMIACLLKRKTFALDYRLSPENKHPAQLEDAIAIYKYLLEKGYEANKIIFIGDSAGGNLALLTLLAIKKLGLKQPACAIGLCPWTDVGNRGNSLVYNNVYDLLQGNMALKFGEWHHKNSEYTREDASPIFHDFKSTSPIYLQGGEYEVLIDMIREFADILKNQGCDVTLDVWKKMTHVFQAHGTNLKESKEAFEKMDAFISRVTLVN